MKKMLLPFTVLLMLATPGAVRADGLPLPVEAAGAGVLSEDEMVRFLTANARGETAAISQDVGSGAVLSAEMLEGRFTVPLVSYDGAAGGLSADGRTLVLIRPRARFPRRRTSFAVLDARSDPHRLRLRRFVHLRGDFSFDALSPDGRSLFLINYISRRNPRRYRVRVYDLKRGRLAPKPIVDPREDPDEMNGLPVSRETSRDGRWAYTLYSGRHHPFVHALDTVRRKAVCIDLDDVRADPFSLRIERGGDAKTLAVMSGQRAIRLVNTRTFEVREPEQRAEAGSAPRTGGVSWPMPAAPVVLVAGLLWLGLRARAARAR